jgi:ligand-binding sensor domain-containing protein
VPTDTLHAAIQIAQHPGAQLGYQTQVHDLYSMVSATSPFQPILASAPNELSLSLNFTGGGGLSSSSTTNSLAVDSSGNLWMTDTAGNKVIEWNNLGAPVTSNQGFTISSMSSPDALAVDSAGNIWVCGGSTLTKLTNLGAEALGSPFYGGGLSGACH